MIKFNDYKNCLLNGEVVLKSQQRFKSKGHDVYTENVNKIALSSNDDKRIVSSDKISKILKKRSVRAPRSNNTREIGGNT